MCLHAASTRRRVRRLTLSAVRLRRACQIPDQGDPSTQECGRCERTLACCGCAGAWVPRWLRRCGLTPTWVLSPGSAGMEPRVECAGRDWDAVLLVPLFLLQQRQCYATPLLPCLLPLHPSTHPERACDAIQVYSNVTNIVVRVSPADLAPEAMEHALLVSSHYDSTLGTPGAADDAVAIAGTLRRVAKGDRAMFIVETLHPPPRAPATVMVQSWWSQ